MSINSQFEQAYAAQLRGELNKAAKLYGGLVLSMPYRANHNLGVVYLHLGRRKEAEAAFRAAMAADPAGAEPAFVLGAMLLEDGRFEEGWPLYERRREVRGMTRLPPEVAYPEWQGEDVAGKRLLVLGEQGFGDAIMLARFFQPLKERGAQIVYVCSDPIRPLFEGQGLELVGSEESVEADHWVFSFSLPMRLGLSVETIPPPSGLTLPPNGSGGGIGVVPTGNKDHRNDANRSLGARDAARLLKMGRDLRPEATGAKDFMETAKIIADLDLVISVDTSVAHLAGAMGKPVWILIPARETDWRWLRGREDSPWYPSARLFRQRVAGDWAPVFRRIEGALK
ncbi:glycosyltransferase family 9 protein [Phenylobacterium sp.]|jgi:hypothetical protein|uniref:glycosyltransferase family 9 protein n=1 Tax=Phenylobacterium sp. TaxID=1871053 RepID=UPI002F9583C5